MGPICSFGETEKLQKGNTEFTLQSRWDRFALSVRPKSYERETESLQSHLGETEIPIGRTDLPRVCGSGYDFQTRWRRIGRIGVTDFGFGFRSFVMWESS